VTERGVEDLLRLALPVQEDFANDKPGSPGRLARTLKVK
jgi:hypothetical protein